METKLGRKFTADEIPDIAKGAGLQIGMFTGEVIGEFEKSGHVSAFGAAHTRGLCQAEAEFREGARGPAN